MQLDIQGEPLKSLNTILLYLPLGKAELLKEGTSKQIIYVKTRMTITTSWSIVVEGTDNHSKASLNQRVAIKIQRSDHALSAWPDLPATPSELPCGSHLFLNIFISIKMHFSII